MARNQYGVRDFYVRANEGVEAASCVSSNHDKFTVLQHECDRLAQVRQTFLFCFSLPVRTRYLGAVSDKPRWVLLDDRGELVAHKCILQPAQDLKIR